VQAALEPGLELVDGLTDGGSLDLGTDQTAVDVDVGLRDHRVGLRGLAVPGQFHPRLQHPLAGLRQHVGDPLAGVLGGTGQVSAGGDDDLCCGIR
jgi:hypothetical protein